MESSQESTARSQDSISGRFIIKWIIAAVIICAGIGGGIYTGFALSDHGYGLPSETALKNTTYLEIGQSFPDYELKDHSTGETIAVSSLVKSGPTLFAFVSSQCGACEMMNVYWEKRIVKNLDKDIQLVWVYDAWEEQNEGFDSTALAGVRVVITDRSKQMLTDGINGTPTFVGLSEDSKIRLIINGFDKNVGADYFNDRL